MKGFTKLDNNLLFSNKLGHYSKLVLMGLTYFTRNGTGKCFCRKQTLSNYLNLSLYQIKLGLDQLEELEVINIQRIGQGHTDIITLKDFECGSEKISDPINIIEEKKEKEEDVSKRILKSEVKSPTPPHPGQENTQKHYSFPVCEEIPPDRSNDLHRLEKSLHRGLEDVLRPLSYQTWFSQSKVVSVHSDKVKIGLPTDKECGWVKENYLSLVERLTNLPVELVKLKQGVGDD